MLLPLMLLLPLLLLLLMMLLPLLLLLLKRAAAIVVAAVAVATFTSEKPLMTKETNQLIKVLPLADNQGHYFYRSHG